MTTLNARPEAITLDAQRSALIVVDMQNAYASKGGYLDLAGFDVSTTQPVIENIKTAVSAARAAGMLIVWFQNGWDDQYVEAGGPGSPNFHKSNALKTMRQRPELQGTLPFDKDNNVVFIDDPKAQTRHVLETIKTVIETAGGTMEDVTFNSIFITDWKNYAAINEIYAEFFPGDKPARFCIQCGLVKPEALVEIATVAHIAK